MNIKNFIKLCTFILFCTMLFSCTSVAKINIASTGDVTVDLDVQPSKNTEVIVKSVGGDVESLFDKEQITANLKTEDIETLSFKANSHSAVSGSFHIPSNRVETSNLFMLDFERKIVACNISKENLLPLINTFPSDIKDYLDLFVSPITTGEDLTATEYEELVNSVYGPNIANELKTAFFKVMVSCPGVISSVKSEPEGRVRYFAGNSATLTVPLSYILSLEEPLKITITYK